MKMTGAKILMECLLEQQVDTIFGYRAVSLSGQVPSLSHVP